MQLTEYKQLNYNPEITGKWGISPCDPDESGIPRRQGNPGRFRSIVAVRVLKRSPQPLLRVRAWIISQASSVISVTPSSEALISVAPSKAQCRGVVYMVFSTLDHSCEQPAFVLSI